MISLVLTSRNGKYNAAAEYEENKIVVKAGSIINQEFAEHIRGGKKAKGYRDNAEFVDGTGKVIKDCVFSSPSTAAQFVTGSSNNGYRVWKDRNGKTLKEILGR